MFNYLNLQRFLNPYESNFLIREWNDVFQKHFAIFSSLIYVKLRVRENINKLFMIIGVHILILSLCILPMPNIMLQTLAACYLYFAIHFF